MRRILPDIFTLDSFLTLLRSRGSRTKAPRRLCFWTSMERRYGSSAGTSSPRCDSRTFLPPGHGMFIVGVVLSDDLLRRWSERIGYRIELVRNQNPAALNEPSARAQGEPQANPAARSRGGGAASVPEGDFGERGRSQRHRPGVPAALNEAPSTRRRSLIGILKNLDREVVAGLYVVSSEAFAERTLRSFWGLAIYFFAYLAIGLKLLVWAADRAVVSPLV